MQFKQHAPGAGEIAVIGMSCRFPGQADDPQRYWQLLSAGRNARVVVPRSRWDADAYYDPRPGAAGKLVSRHAAFLDDVFGFDARFFGIAAREAISMDPQQRLLLELGWEVLDHAGVVLDGQTPPERCGVFAGIMNNDYARLHLLRRGLSDIDAYHLTGNWFSFFAGRLAYTLGLRGPVLAVDAACASSLVAVHLAMQSLRRHECDVALAGAVSLILSPELSLVLSSAGALSPDGLSKAFDRRADGMGRGEGGGLVALKRLEDAVADGDEIWGVLRGSAVNHCGAGPGFTVPSMRAQQELIRNALHDSGVAAKDVDYVEAHGTGTRVGDPIEAQAIGGVYRDGRSDSLLIGSAKTNLGHLDAAAGMAGLIKTLLALHHERIPPHLHFTSWNPEIDAESLKLAIPTELTPWQRSAKRARLAGVSAFGMSGMNAHVIVQEAPMSGSHRVSAGGNAGRSAMADQSSVLLPISARCEEALAELARRYLAELERSDEVGALRLAAGAALKRAHQQHRLAVSGPPHDLAARLSAALERRARGPEAARPEPLVFVFSGQGEQWPGMGRALLASNRAFRDAVGRCDQLLLGRLGWSVTAVLEGSASMDLRDTLVAQPLVFTLQYALLQALEVAGIRPAAVVGHSLGEIAAACAAERLSLSDALDVVVARAGAMAHTADSGTLLVVMQSQAELGATLAAHPTLSVGAVNAPAVCVVTGSEPAVQQLGQELEARGVTTVALGGRYPFHSPALGGAQRRVEQELRQLVVSSGRIPFISSIDGSDLGDAPVDAAYWGRQLREPVRFLDSITSLLEQGYGCFLELGPHATLTPHLRSAAKALHKEIRAFSLLRRGQDSQQTFLEALGALYEAGQELEWAGLFAAVEPELGRLPAYPWQRRELVHPAEPMQGEGTALMRSAGHGLLGHPVEQADGSGRQLWSVGRGAVLREHWAGHRIKDQVVFPGAAYVEIFVEMAKQCGHAGPLELRDVSFEELMELESGARRVVSSAQLLEDGLSLEIRSRPESPGVGQSPMFSRHASARLLRHAGIEARHAYDGFVIGERMDGLLKVEHAQRCATHHYDGEAHYQALEAAGMVYSGRFRAVTEVWRRDGEAVGRVLESPSDVGAESWSFEPALLDACLQVAAAALSEGLRTACVPVRIESFELVGQRPRGTLWVRARVREELGPKSKLELWVYASDGMRLAHCQGLTLQRTAAREQALDCFYEPRWIAQPELRASSSMPKNVLLFERDAGFAMDLTRALKQQGVGVTLVRLDAAEQPANQLWLRSTDSAAYEKLLAQFADRELCLVFGPSEAVSEQVEATWEQLERTCAVPVLALRARVTTAQDGMRSRAWIITRASHAGAALQASASGIAKSVTLEHPEIVCTHLDLALALSREEAVAGALAELSSDHLESAVALDGTRRVARLVAARPTNEVAAAPSEGGTWLLSGGHGGVGLAHARWLVGRGVKRIALLSRSAASAEAQAEIEALRQLGADVRSYSCDVTRTEQVNEAVASVVRELGPINGVIHGAGVLADAVLANLKWEACRKVLGPKVLGAFNLLAALRSQPVTSLWLLSSATSLLGNAGQVAYAAANAVLDGIASDRATRNQPGLAINWGAWSDAGMLRGSAASGRSLAAKGISGMATKQCLEALERVAGRSAGQVGIIQLGASAWFEATPRAARLPYWAALAPSERKQGASVLARTNILAQAPRARQRALAEHVCGVIASVLRIAVEEVSPLDSLERLGLDSLMVVEVKNKLEASLSVGISVSTIWAHPVVRDLCAHLAVLLGMNEATSKSEAAFSANERAALVELRDRLSKDMARN